MTPKVVHVLSEEWKRTAPDMRLYIGRAMPGFRESLWANPYRINVSQGTTREWVLRAYEQWLRKELTNPAPHARTIQQLRSDQDNYSVLGCWCKATAPGDKDFPCHGDILVEVGKMDEATLGRWLAGEFNLTE